MKKWMIWVSVLISMVIVMAGCSSGSNATEETSAEAEDGNITLEYFTFSPGEAHEEDLKQMIEEFESQNPDITIDYEMAAYEDYFTKLQTRIAGGDAPDTFELNYENFVNYASKGTLMELDTLIEEDENFSPDQLNQQAYEAFQYDGKQYGMVESFSNVVLFYNKELFDKAGVEYPTADWTWEDELAAAEKLTDKENGVWGTYAPFQFNEFFKTIAQNGGSVFNEDKTEATVNSEANIEALQWMADKVNEYGVTPSDEEMSGQSDGDLFVNGQLAMLRTGIWMIDSFSEAGFEWDIALEPGNTQKAHHFFANGLAVSADTEHPEAAWKWVEFMSASKEAAQIRIDSAWELPAVSDESITQGYLEQTPPESREVVFEALETLVVPPVIEDWNKLNDAFMQELDQVKLGSKTPEDALNDLQPTIEELINE